VEAFIYLSIMMGVPAYIATAPVIVLGGGGRAAGRWRVGGLFTRRLGSNKKCRGEEGVWQVGSGVFRGDCFGIRFGTGLTMGLDLVDG
jgi:hypothetical protein